MSKIKIYSPKVIANARNLRKNSTPWERKLWSFLKSSKFYGFKFRRQYPIGKYIVDFCCVKIKLFIELDGGHHMTPENLAYDQARQLDLVKLGYSVLRIQNIEIDNNLEGVGEVIFRALNPHPQPFS